MPLTYASYLKLDQLLDLQEFRSKDREHDELLFIIIHQVYELWFKQVLHEMDHLIGLLDQSDLPRAQHTLKRILTILKTMVSQLDILETMSPTEFLSFREFLASSSGFQSAQFRELEFVLGHKRPQVLERFPENSPEHERLQARLASPGLWDAFLHCLHAHDLPVPSESLSRDPTQPLAPDPEVQHVLIQVYRNHPSLTQLCELLVDLDEGLQEWRYRHVKMVERTIGNKQGTGGSSGVDYLAKTLFRPVFPDLWAIRTEL